MLVLSPAVLANAGLLGPAQPSPAVLHPMHTQLCAQHTAAFSQPLGLSLTVVSLLYLSDQCRSMFSCLAWDTAPR